MMNKMPHAVGCLTGEATYAQGISGRHWPCPATKTGVNPVVAGAQIVCS